MKSHFGTHTNPRRPIFINKLYSSLYYQPEYTESVE
jgi:hypothetical protein